MNSNDELYIRTLYCCLCYPHIKNSNKKYFLRVDSEDEIDVFIFMCPSYLRQKRESWGELSGV